MKQASESNPRPVSFEYVYFWLMLELFFEYVLRLNEGVMGFHND